LIPRKEGQECGISKYSSGRGEEEEEEEWW